MTLPGIHLEPISGSNGLADLNADLVRIDQHDHTGLGDGVKLTQRSLNVDGEVNFNSQRLFNVSEVDHVTITQANFTGSNKTAFLPDGNFYVRDGNGNLIQFSRSGSIIVPEISASIVNALLNSTNTWSGASNTFLNRVVMGNLTMSNDSRASGRFLTAGTFTAGSDAFVQGTLHASGNVFLCDSGADTVTMAGVLRTSQDVFLTGPRVQMTNKLEVSGGLDARSDLNALSSLRVSGSTVHALTVTNARDTFTAGTSHLSGTLLGARAVFTTLTSSVDALFQDLDVNDRCTLNAGLVLNGQVLGDWQFGTNSNVQIEGGDLQITGSLLVTGSSVLSNDISVGGATQALGALRLVGQEFITLGADQDNFNPTSFVSTTQYFIQDASPRTITGLLVTALSSNKRAGHVVRFFAKNNGDITFMHNTTSTAGNRFFNQKNRDIVIGLNQMVEYTYVFQSGAVGWHQSNILSGS